MRSWFNPDEMARLGKAYDKAIASISSDLGATPAVNVQAHVRWGIMQLARAGVSDSVQLEKYGAYIGRSYADLRGLSASKEV